MATWAPTAAPRVARMMVVMMFARVAVLSVASVANLATSLLMPCQTLDETGTI